MTFHKGQKSRGRDKLSLSRILSCWLPSGDTHSSNAFEGWGGGAVTNIKSKSKPLILYSLHCEGQPSVSGGLGGASRRRRTHLKGKIYEAMKMFFPDS